MTDSILLNRIFDKLAVIDGRIDKIENRLEKLEDRVNVIGGRLTGIEDSRRTAGGILSVVTVFLVALTLAVVGMGVWTFETRVREIAREVVREGLANRQTYVQTGRFAAATQVPGLANAFDWGLLTPVDPGSLLELRAEPTEFIPGVGISAQLIDGGRKCRMTIHTKPGEPAPPLPIDAQVTIVYRAPAGGP